jgi:hypothetical protein
LTEKYPWWRANTLKKKDRSGGGYAPVRTINAKKKTKTTPPSMARNKKAMPAKNESIQTSCMKVFCKHG